MERLGLVGMTNAGKSSLFNALTGGNAAVAAHPYATTTSSTGIAQVPDARLEALAELHHSKKIVRAAAEVVDIAGLAAGAEQGEGLGNRFLGGIREVDALCYVLRAFESDEIVGEDDPAAALGVLELELVLADLSSVEAQLHKQRKPGRVQPSDAAPLPVLRAAAAALEAGVPLYRSSLDAEQRAELRPAFLLTNKPVLAVVNVGEEQVQKADDFVLPVQGELGDAADVLAICVQLEAEAARLEEGERRELLEGLGLGEGALARVSRAAYHLIGRRTFFTTGPDESRAWTFRTGAHAPECAGVIHSDLQRGFIRAEVIAWDELVELGSWNAAKAAGRLRVEGKDYEVQDGDVLEIRFNV